MIYFNEINKKFKVDFWNRSFNALEKVSFKISEGQITGFLGANGAGKTTLIKILMNLIRPTSGQVEFNKKLGCNPRKILSGIGYLPERPYFYPHLTGKEFIQYLSLLNDVPSDVMRKRLGFWAERLNLAFALDRKIRSYSKGMLQRLGFISTIIHDPQVIILDEPLSGLDPIGRKEIKDAIVEINNKGKTIFFSSHIIPDVEEVCQAVVFLEKGKIIYDGSIHELINKNIKPNYIIKAVLNPQIGLKTECSLIENYQVGENKYYNVSWDQKDNLIKEILSHNGKIESMNQNKITLEEIFYKIRKDDKNV